MSNPQTIGMLPYTVKAVNQDGTFTRDWYLWLDQTWRRNGGPTAPTNVELSEMFDSALAFNAQPGDQATKAVSLDTEASYRQDRPMDIAWLVRRISDLETRVDAMRSATPANQFPVNDLATYILGGR